MSMKRKLAAAALTTLVGGGAMIGLAPGAGATGIGLAAFVDDWCGTPWPQKFPIPIPQPQPDPLGGVIVGHTDVVLPALDAGVLGAEIGQLDLGAGVGAGGFGR